METTHTPGPWRIIRDSWIVGNMGETICMMLFTKPSARADAELIVRAVNSHAELVAALSAILNYFDPYSMPIGGGELALVLARSALAKAKGEA